MVHPTFPFNAYIYPLRPLASTHCPFTDCLMVETCLVYLVTPVSPRSVLRVVDTLDL